MKIKVVLCNCRGLSGTFESDMNSLPFALESELDIDYTVVHPELCGQGGRQVLADIMSNADGDTYIICGACDPKTQETEFADLLKAHQFPRARFFPIDIRLASNDRIVDRLRNAVEAVIGLPKNV